MMKKLFILFFIFALISFLGSAVIAWVAEIFASGVGFGLFVAVMCAVLVWELFGLKRR